MSKFKVGDRVAKYSEVGMIKGKIVDQRGNPDFYEIETIQFQRIISHEKQLRRLKKKPKKVKKEVRGWANVYPNDFGFIHKTREEADSIGRASDGRIACVEVVGHYEVEE